MIRRDYARTSGSPSVCGEDAEYEEYVWSSSEKSKMRAMTLLVIRSIVEKHGGKMEVDLETDTINIDVPREAEMACARDIEEQVGSVCW